MAAVILKVLGLNQPELPERFLETTPGTDGNGL